MYEDFDYKRYIVLIEWSYTESYGETSKAIPVRLETYRKFYQNGPLNTSLIPDFSDLFYVPFYQLMPQQMLAHEMAKHKELGAQGVSVLHFAPDINKDFQKVTSPAFRTLGDTAIDVWKKVVRDPTTFTSVSTEQLFRGFPVIQFPQLQDWWGYVTKRYGWMQRL